MSLDKFERICKSMVCTPNDILVFLPDEDDEE
ncbi:MAG: hypothetical protein ACK5LC_01305 [Coprobacillaceae bacterium]